MVIACVMTGQLLLTFGVAIVIQRLRRQHVSSSRLFWRPICSLFVSTLYVNVSIVENLY